MWYRARETLKTKNHQLVSGESLMTPQEYLTNNGRFLFLYGPIAPYLYKGNECIASYLIDNMIAMAHEDPAAPIKLIIDSEGGDADSGFQIYDAMNSLSCPVYTIGRSCASMAAILFAAGQNGHRYLYKNSKFMLHLPYGEIRGDSAEIAIKSREIEKVRDDLVKVLIDNGAKKNKEEILADINREKWFNAQEVIDYGIADKIITRENSPFNF